MLDKVMEFMLTVLGIFKFWYVLDCYEKGIKLRFGKYKKTLDPGLHFMLPLYIDQVLADNIVPTTIDLGKQSLETLDGYNIVINAIILWRISNIKKILLEVEESEDLLQDICYGVISELISKNKWTDIQCPSFALICCLQMNREIHQYGIQIKKVCFSDKSITKTIRLMMQ